MQIGRLILVGVYNRAGTSPFAFLMTNAANARSEEATRLLKTVSRVDCGFRAVSIRLGGCDSTASRPARRNRDFMPTAGGNRRAALSRNR